MLEFLDWLARATGVIAITLATLGFIFKEKWKQILQRSLAEDLERLKSELAKSQADHIASLTPQLEQIKHDFQQKLEAYKVSLIAETESVKAKSELRKSIALKYAENEFEQLMKLQLTLSPITSLVVAFITTVPAQKTVQQLGDYIAEMQALSKIIQQASVFLTHEYRLEIAQLQQQIHHVSLNRIGPGTLSLNTNAPEINDLMLRSAKILNYLQDKIISLGKM